MSALARLAGPKQKISMLVSVTVIEQGDLASRLLDHKRHPEFNGRRYGVLRSLPSRMDLWKEYRDIRSKSLIEHRDTRDAQDFYRLNHAAMNEGAVVAWPERYEPHNIDALEYCMEIWCEDEVSFWAEYMNQPLNRQLADVRTLDPELVAERITGIPRGIVPDWAEYVTAAIDVQQDSLWWLVSAWDHHMRGHVVDYGVWPEQGRPYITNNDIKTSLRQFHNASTVELGIEAGIDALGTYLMREYPKQTGSPKMLDMLGIDANWNVSRSIVFAYCRQKFGGKAVPMIGRYVGATTTNIDQWKIEKGAMRGPSWITQIGSIDQRHVVFDSNMQKSWLAGH